MKAVFFIPWQGGISLCYRISQSFWFLTAVGKVRRRKNNPDSNGRIYYTGVLFVPNAMLYCIKGNVKASPMVSTTVKAGD